MNGLVTGGATHGAVGLGLTVEVTDGGPQDEVGLWPGLAVEEASLAGGGAPQGVLDWEGSSGLIFLTAGGGWEISSGNPCLA